VESERDARGLAFRAAGRVARRAGRFMMIALGVLVLLQLAPALPTPTPSGGATLGRSTPVPAGGSLQDLAQRRKDLAPGDSPKGGFSVSPEGSTNWFRYENLTIRPVREGLLFEGSVLNLESTSEWVSLELLAKRRDGSFARDFIFFDTPREARSSTHFRQILHGSVDDMGPAGLLRDTAAVRVETCEIRVLLEIVRERTGPYADRKCLVFWSRVVAGAGGDDVLEVHAQNNCSAPVRAVDTWFKLSVHNGNSGANLERCQRFAEDVAPRMELQKSIKIPIERGASISLHSATN
jgi:hypothetical protein